MLATALPSKQGVGEFFDCELLENELIKKYMPSYRVAHLREQGVDLIIIPLESAFGHKSSSEQDETISALQIAANSAGLAGAVVPVWDSGGGRMAFIAPPNWHPFFKSLSLNSVHRNINKEISW